MKEKTVSILDSLGWSVQPKLGLVKGDYYREEDWFAPYPGGPKGFYGVLEAVSNGGELQMAEFNELNVPTYYIHKYQNASKRYSDYGFLQASKERMASTHVVLVNGVTYVEEQMAGENRLDRRLDLLTGVSNSIRESMLVLAEGISGHLKKPPEQCYHGHAQETGPGIAGRLQVAMGQGRIVSCFYGEMFVNQPEDIGDVELKTYYKQSKYYSLDYVSNYPCGFNTLFDMQREHVSEGQNLLDLAGLRSSEGEFFERVWGNYLKVTDVVWQELLKGGAIKERSQEMRDEPANRTFFSYNMVCSITIYDGGTEAGEILDRVQEMAFQIRRMLDSYDEELEFGRLDKGHVTGVPYEVSEELCRLLAEPLEFSKLSEGCFDPTVGPVIRLWDITARSPRKPLKEEIERVRSRTGTEYMSCDARKRIVTFEWDGMVADARDARKGYTVGRVTEYLESWGVRSASVSFRGNLYLIGPKRSVEGQTAGGEASTEGGMVKVGSADMVEVLWKVGTRAPWSREMESIGMIELQGCGTTISGGYDRYFSGDEKIYRHLPDPRTGYPADDTLDNVAVVSDDMLYTGLLSTTCFVMGGDTVGRICKRVGDHVDYILVKKDGTITVSDGLHAHFKRNDS